MKLMGVGLGRGRRGGGRDANMRYGDCWGLGAGLLGGGVG